MLSPSLSSIDSSSKTNANELILVASIVRIAPSLSNSSVHSLASSPSLTVIHFPWTTAGISPVGTGSPLLVASDDGLAESSGLAEESELSDAGGDVVSLVVDVTSTGSLAEGLVVSSGVPPHAASEATTPMERRLTSDFLIIFAKLQHLSPTIPWIRRVAHPAKKHRTQPYRSRLQLPRDQDPERSALTAGGVGEIVVGNLVEL